MPARPGTPDRHRLAAEFSLLLGRIRAQPGFGAFLQPPTVEELIGESAHGPIIVYTIDRRRSDAILLSGDGIADLPLPGLKADVLSERITTFHQALETARDRQANSGQRRAAQATLHGILEWLWDTAAEPVLDKLGFRAPPEHGDPYPRVWWVPGGLLGLLPLHAAGYHREIPAPVRAGARSWTVLLPPTPPPSAPCATPAAASHPARIHPGPYRRDAHHARGAAA